MGECTITKHRNIRPHVRLNAVVLLLLLIGALLGSTQLFIVLVVYSLVIAPV